MTSSKRIAELLGVPADVSADPLGLTPDQRRRSDVDEFTERFFLALRPIVAKIDQAVLEPER